MNEFETLLKETTKDILSEENLQKITEAFNAAVENNTAEKVELAVEAALVKQDQTNAKDLEKLLEDIDEDHTKKLERVVESLEAKHSTLLKNVMDKYKKEFVTESKAFKDDLVNKLDKFFTISLENAIPQKQINEAVENTYYKKAFNQIKKLVAISEVSTNELVKTGILEAKGMIDEKDQEIKTLTEKSAKFEKELNRLRVKDLLNEKCAGLPKDKTEYIKRVLGNKSEKFITENFDYTIKMYDKDDSESLEKVKEDAKKSSKILSEGIDRPDETVITEDIDDGDINPYMQELSKY